MKAQIRILMCVCVAFFTCESRAVLNEGQSRPIESSEVTAPGQTRLRAAVAEVRGIWTGDEGRVVWSVGSVWGTAGFFVYRVNPETGAETRLNDPLVPVAFYQPDARYEVADPAAREGETGTYRLEEVELTGDILDLGVTSVVFLPPPPVSKTVLAPKASAPVPRVAPKTVGTSSMLKVLFKKEGIYGVNLQSIADGLGRPLEEVQALVDRSLLAVVSEGGLLPILHDVERNRIVFHGKPTDNRYTRDTAVLISVGKGPPMPRREPGATGGLDILPVEVEVEEDHYPFDSATVPREDLYYWDYVISGNETLGQRDFVLDLSGYAGWEVEMTVHLMGWSSTLNNPDHRAEFLFNGTPVGSVTFDGQESVEAGLIIPASIVSNGVNTLSVKGVLQPGCSFSYFVVDGFELMFDRYLAPQSGTAYFYTDGEEPMSAAAFTDPLVLALDDRQGLPTWIADADGGLPDKAWAVEPGDERFAVIEADAVPMLEPAPAAADAWFLSETNRIDYLILTSRELEPAAQELAEYRSGQGLRVGVAVFEDVCDLFWDGQRSPEAIPELLFYASETWAEAPWMMVLAGNGHFDYLGTLSDEPNPLPPLLAQTASGLFASDGLLSDLDGDETPEIATGRLPARTPAELTSMIAKIKAYEADFGASWQNELTLAADQGDLAGDFSAANDALAALVDDTHSVAERIDLDSIAITPARAALANRLQVGTGFLHYTGHGMVNQFSAQGLLTTTDVNGMTNARTPVVMALSCLTGRYEAPGLDSMSEQLMRRAGGGAVAVWAASGLPCLYPSMGLGEAFYQNVLQEGDGTLGPAILRARQSVVCDMFTRDSLLVYNLLGDPALRIAGNTQEPSEEVSFAQWRWQRFSPAELADPETAGSIDRTFSEYALGNDSELLAELPEFGFPLSVEEPIRKEPGFVLRWKRRIQHSDVEYRLASSPDLMQWETESADLEIVSVEPDPDGVMETVRTWVNSPPGGSRIFLGIQAIRQ